MAGLVGGGGKALGDIIKKPLQGMAKQRQLFVFAYILPCALSYIVRSPFDPTQATRTIF